MNNKLLEIARLEIGVKEFPAGGNKVKYNTWFYNREVFDGDKPGAKYPWCGTFVSWLFFTAGLPLGVIDYTRGFAGCIYAVNNVYKWGKVVTVPMPGDIVFYDWDGNGTFEHTGLFIQDLGHGLFQAIEGNTSLKNQSNGGEVMLRSDRKYKQAIFVRPNILLK